MCGRNLQGQLGLGDPSNFVTNERGHPYQVRLTVGSITFGIEQS
jgi:hypothetical protein